MTNTPCKVKQHTTGLKQPCRYCGRDVKASERKPKNGYFEVYYCSKPCRVSWHSMRSLEKKSDVLKSKNYRNFNKLNKVGG